MRQLEELLDLVARKIGLSTDDIARRSAVFDITDADIALLRQLHDKLAAHQPPLVESFHSYLTQFPELKQWLGDGDKLERLKQAQLGYFNRLSQGNYDSGYVTDRLRVGLVHQQIGLEPKWYVGAYRKYLSDVIPVLAEAAAGDREQFFRACDALLKVVCFDMVLALDTYFEADRSEVVRVKNYAEQMLASIPSGLIVLDAELKIRSMNHAMCRMFRLGPGTRWPACR